MNLAKITEDYYLAESELSSITSKIVLKVKGGEVSPFAAMALAKDLSKIGEVVEKEVRPIMNKSEGLVDKVSSYNGYKFELTEAGTTYDFSVCGDPILEDLEEKLAAAKKAVDERKAFLKSIPEGAFVSVVTPETGEESQVCRALKKSSTTFKMTKIKQ